MSIDPNLLNVMLSVAANGLTSLLATSGRKVEELVIGKEFLDKWEREKTYLAPNLQKAIVSISEFGIWKGPAREEIVSLFFLTPEVEDVVRQIYSTNQITSTDLKNLSSLRAIFLTLLTQFVANYPSDVELKKDDLVDCANSLFDTLLSECDLVLNNAIDKGILSSHEAKSAFRHNLLLSEINAIHKKLDFFTTQEQIKVSSILEFEKKYRQQVSSRHGYITPPNLDAAHPLPINNLYVYPRIARISKDNAKLESVKSHVFLSRIHRAVLLGNPGAGKSTLTIKLCHDLATKSSTRLLSGRKDLTPILVILRNYGIEKNEHKCSIRDFIETEVKTRYQISDIPIYAFEYLLLNGRVAVIFDGLDELLDTTHRQEIRDDVQSFCNLYPSVPILVTSRQVGYEQAPLDSKMFETFHLDAFDNEQVEEYVEKWFTIADEADLTEKQRQSRIVSFIEECEVVPDLRSNPLMLALLCNIYRQEGYIPKYRPDVYEKCALMLFERWDRNRKLYTPPLPEEHVRPLLEYLANWIYKNDRLRTGVTEGELTDKTTEYLQDWLYENIHKAKKIAKDFIEFCTGRAWVFTDTGTQKRGEKLYQFSHATFLEYFTASHLVQVCRTPKALIELLSPKIAKREWDVVAQLAFQLQAKKSSGAADELLTILLNQSKKNKNEIGWNLLSFIVRCLQFITPRPVIRREITKVCIDQCMDWGNQRLLDIYSKHDGSEEIAEEVIGNLLGSTAENCTTIAETLESLLKEYINLDRNYEMLLALEIGLSLTYLSSNYELSQEHREVWENVENNLLNMCINRIEEIGPKSFLLCLVATLKGKVSVANLVKWQGAESIFLDYNSVIFPVLYTSLFRLFIPVKLDEDFYDEIGVDEDELLPFLKEVGQVLPTQSTPWLDKQNVAWSKSSISFDVFEDIKLLEIDPEALFGSLVLYAVWLESQNPTRQSFILSEMEKATGDIFSSINWILLARFEPALLKRAQAQMNKFTKEQQIFIWHWISKEINLVKNTN